MGDETALLRTLRATRGDLMFSSSSISSDSVRAERARRRRCELELETVSRLWKVADADELKSAGVLVTEELAGRVSICFAGAEESGF